ncbi:DDE-type integrase/transposase/recombinase [Ralstonia solanacearum]|uniref:DDE-type integrase/transposase/recombinase n=1 Tax=Ralstonia solanacearum TaxID=305 RepID=UPI0018D03944|nr:DDE-type integrase/transposase/recombinase [Ralstonia solanacearum]
MLELGEGQSVTLHGRLFRVVNVCGDRSVSLLNERTSSVKRFARSEIAGYWADGVLKVVQVGDLVRRHDGLPSIPSALPEPHRLELARRMRYVLAVLGQTANYSLQREVQPIVASISDRLKDPRPPSTATVYRWCRAYMSSSQDIMSVAPRTLNCGRRRGQVDDEVVDAFFEIVDEYFLTMARNTRSDAHALLVDRILEINKGRPREQLLKTISFNTFCRWVSHFIDPFIMKARREGLAVATRHYRQRGQGPVALFPLERVEVDHTIADIELIDPVTHEVVGRPTCTVAIDRCTRMVCAIHIDWAPPSSIAVLMCLQQMMESKQPILDSLHGVEGFSWPVQGKPNLFCIDNGAEFHGQHYKRLCQDLGIDIQYCPPGKPWYKGAVERFLRTLNTGLIHRLPGTTRTNPQDRGAYRSGKMASLTLQQLRQEVWKWVVVEYHNRRHRELGETPFQAWSRLTRQRPILPLPDAQKIELDTGLTFEVAVKNGRVRAKNLVYHHPYLVHLQGRLKDTQKTMLRVNPQDVSKAYLLNPFDRSLIQLKCLNREIAQGTTWEDFRRQRRDSSSEVAHGATLSEEDLRHAKVAQIRTRHELHIQAEQALARKQRRKRDALGKTVAGDLSPARRRSAAPRRTDRANDIAARQGESDAAEAGWAVGTLAIAGGALQ